MNKRKAQKFVVTAHNSWLDDYVYRREPVIYRSVLRWMLDQYEAKSLVQELADLFAGGRVPILSLGLSKRNNLGGQFKVRADGREVIRVRGVSLWKCKIDQYGINSRCKEVRITIHDCYGGEYPVTTILHEFAHYLAWLWWGDGSHNGAWASTSEMLHEWYARKRGYKGTSHRVTVTREKLKSTLK